MYAASSVAMLRNARSRPILLAWFSLALGVGGPHSVRADDSAQDAHAPPSADRAEPPAVAAEREHFSLEHFTLANGVEIVLDPMPGRSTAAVTVSVDRGTRDQRRGWTGLAHVTEHVLFGGTRDTPGDWNERIESLGRIDGNGVTTSDRTYY
jgi:zinc protease